MGLFQKKTIPFTIPLYSIGNERTKLIVGLGNVGKKYLQNRHNIGFLCLDYASSLDGIEWKDKKNFKSHLSEIRKDGKRILYAKPTTLMNLSGEAVLAIKQYYKIDNKDILVIHDELAIPFGSLRYRFGGSSAGHNGIKSVTSAIGEDYGRLRIGIANENSKKGDSADFVLKNFSNAEQDQFKNLYKETHALVTEFIYSDSLQPDTRKFI